MAEVVIDSWDKWVQVATTGIGTVESPNFGSVSDPLKITLGTDLDWNEFEDRYTTGWIPIGCTKSETANNAANFVNVPLYISEFDGNGKEIKNLNIMYYGKPWMLIRPYISRLNGDPQLSPLQVHDLKLTDIDIACSDFYGVIEGNADVWEGDHVWTSNFIITGNIYSTSAIRLITQWGYTPHAYRCGFSGTATCNRWDGFFGYDRSTISESYVRANIIANEANNLQCLISHGTASNCYFIGTYKMSPTVINTAAANGIPTISSNNNFVYAVIKNIDEWLTMWNFHPDENVNSDLFYNKFGGNGSVGKFFYDTNLGKGYNVNLEPTHESPKNHSATTAQLQDPSWLASKGFAIYSGG